LIRLYRKHLMASEAGISGLMFDLLRFYRICIIRATEKDVLKARPCGHGYVLAGQVNKVVLIDRAYCRVQAGSKS
jgi:hypothetical protein